MDLFYLKCWILYLKCSEARRWGSGWWFWGGGRRKIEAERELVQHAETDGWRGHLLPPVRWATFVFQTTCILYRYKIHHFVYKIHHVNTKFTTSPPPPKNILIWIFGLLELTFGGVNLLAVVAWMTWTHWSNKHGWHDGYIGATFRSTFFSWEFPWEFPWDFPWDFWTFTPPFAAPPAFPIHLYHVDLGVWFCWLNVILLVECDRRGDGGDRCAVQLQVSTNHEFCIQIRGILYQIRGILYQKWWICQIRVDQDGIDYHTKGVSA